MRLTATALFLLLVLTAARLWIAATVDVTPDEAYYWMCANRLDWAFFDGPGGTAALVKGGLAVFGDTPLGLRAAFPLAALAASLALFLLGRGLFGPATGVWSAAALNAIPIFNLASVHAGSGMPALACLLAAAFAVWKAIENHGGLVWWLMAGFALGAGVQFRYVVLFSWAGILAVCLTGARHRREFRGTGIYLALLLTIAAAAPAFLWNQANHWAPFALGTLRTALTLDWVSFAGAVVEGMGALSFFGCLLAAFSAGLLISEARLHFHPRYLLLWSAPFALVWLAAAFHKETGLFDLLTFTALVIPGAVRKWQERQRLAGVLVPICIVAAAGFSATFLFQPSQRGNPWMPEGGPIPWKNVARAMETLRTKVQADRPDPIFFIAKDPAFTAALNYFLPQVARDGTHEVFLRESQDLSTQFGLWPGYDDFVETKTAPDEFFTELRAENPYTGRSAIYVTDEEALPQTITGAFEHVSPAATLRTGDGKGSVRQLRLYFCDNYQTMSL